MMRATSYYKSISGIPMSDEVSLTDEQIDNLNIRNDEEVVQCVRCSGNYVLKDWEVKQEKEDRFPSYGFVCVDCRPCKGPKKELGTFILKAKEAPVQAPVKEVPTSKVDGLTPKQRICYDYVGVNPGCSKLAAAATVINNKKYAGGYACVNALVNKGVLEAREVPGKTKKYAMYAV